MDTNKHEFFVRKKPQTTKDAKERENGLVEKTKIRVIRVPLFLLAGRFVSAGLGRAGP